MLLTRKSRKYCVTLAILILGSVLNGCASIVESVVDTAVDTVVDVVVDAVIRTAIACIDNDKPVLEGTLPNPILNHEYNGIIHVGIRNEPYDNLYDYSFALLGNLPQGMKSESAGRQIRLTGTPTSAGKFEFMIRVKVEDAAVGAKDTKGLCFTMDIEGFQWTIQETENERFPL